MIGRDIVVLIMNDARTKPHIAEIVERAYDYTDEEVDNLAVPLPWYRNAIKEMRRRKAAEIALEAAEGYANDMGCPIDTPPAMGTLVRYMGNSEQFKTEKGMFIGLKTGYYFFIDDYVWLDAFCLGSKEFVELPWEIIQDDYPRNEYAKLVLSLN